MSVHIAREFSARYAHTWMRLSIGKAAEKVYYIAEVGEGDGIKPDATDFMVVLMDNQNSKMAVSYDEIKLDLSLPLSRVVTVDGNLLFASQRADRQWKRGICNGTYSVLSPLEGYFKELNSAIYNEYILPPKIGNIFFLPNRKEVSWTRFADALFEPVKDHYLVAHKQMQTNLHLVSVFNEHYFLTLSAKGKEFLWWRDCLPIASVSMENPLQISCYENGMFRQEISDYLRSLGLSYGQVN